MLLVIVLIFSVSAVQIWSRETDNFFELADLRDWVQPDVTTWPMTDIVLSFIDTNTRGSHHLEDSGFTWTLVSYSGVVYGRDSINYLSA